MELSLSLVKEDASALTDVVCSCIAPLDVDWVLLVVDLDLVAIDFNASIDLFN
jgi:hypothetical protein